MSTLCTFIATVDDVDTILELTNSAFMADAFFKKPEYHLRFDAATVKEMIAAQNSRFIIAKQVIDGSETKCGSIFFHWTVESTGTCLEVTGKFSAVSVPTRFEKRGIGKTLVKAVEAQLQEIAQTELATARNGSNIPSLSVNMEMGVINQRKDLFPWYEGQGYKVIEALPHDAELARICLEDSDVHCILMRKQFV